MDEITQNKRIDDYLMNRLDEKERAVFMAEVAQDPVLKNELEIRKAMIQQVKTIGDLRLKEKILEIQQKVEAKKKKVGRRRFLSVVSIAAAVAFIFIIAQWFNQPNDPQDLFAQYYSAYDQLPFHSRNTENQEADVLEAGNFYQQGKYAEALPLLEQIQSAGKADSRTTLALAISQIELKRYEAAIFTLEKTTNESGFFYQDQADWYTALAYLKLERIGKSKQLLQAIADRPTAYFHKEATALLKKLEGLR